MMIPTTVQLHNLRKLAESKEIIKALVKKRSKLPVSKKEKQRKKSPPSFVNKLKTLEVGSYVAEASCNGAYMVLL